MNPGGCCPHERVKLMDQEGIDKSILYPTLGLDWPGSARTPKSQQPIAAYITTGSWIFATTIHSGFIQPLSFRG